MSYDGHHCHINENPWKSNENTQYVPQYRNERPRHMVQARERLLKKMKTCTMCHDSHSAAMSLTWHCHHIVFEAYGSAMAVLSNIVSLPWHSVAPHHAIVMRHILAK